MLSLSLRLFQPAASQLSASASQRQHTHSHQLPQPHGHATRLFILMPLSPLLRQPLFFDASIISMPPTFSLRFHAADIAAS
jgi:hypothetical protein